MWQSYLEPPSSLLLSRAKETEHRRKAAQLKRALVIRMHRHTRLTRTECCRQQADQHCCRIGPGPGPGPGPGTRTGSRGWPVQSAVHGRR